MAASERAYYRCAAWAAAGADGCGLPERQPGLVRYVGRSSVPPAAKNAHPPPFWVACADRSMVYSRDSPNRRLGNPMAKQDAAQHDNEVATMAYQPKGLIIKYNAERCPDPVYVDEVQGVVTPSGMINLSLYFDCPDFPKVMKSSQTSVSEQGAVSFGMPDPPFEAEDGFITFTRRVGANVIMPREAA